MSTPAAAPLVRTSPLRGRLLAAAVGVTCLTMSSGCYFSGGPGWSADRFTYPSTSWAPQTVTLIDVRTGETLWSVDVPVGEQLVVSFHRNSGEGDYTPDMMHWQLMQADTRFGTLHNRMPVPPRDARIMEVSLRRSPELPTAVLTERGPAEASETLRPIEPDGWSYDKQ